MGCKTYEADKHGRIYIYPSLNSSAGKSDGLLKLLIKTLISVAGVIRRASKKLKV